MKLFDLTNKKLISDCKPLLEKLYIKHKKAYTDLFFYEKAVTFDKLDLSPLVTTGILTMMGLKLQANVQVFPLAGKFICTDFMISFRKIENNRIIRGRDDVWAILAYESPFIAKKAIVEKGDIVLDLATGSGVIALLCADIAKKVVATDINPKAINYAKFNAILNRLDHKIDFRLGNMFDPVKNLKFDLIIWNGPTISVPNNPDKYPTYCFGGIDGLNFIRKFIEQAPLFLTTKGRMQWLDPSVGNMLPESLKIIKSQWKNRKYKVIYEKRVEPSDIFKTIDYLDKRLIDQPIKNRPQTPLWIKPLTKKEYYSWIKYLKEHNFTKIFAGMYMIYPSNKFQIQQTKSSHTYFKRMNQLPAEWHFLSYKNILKQLKICESY